MTATVVTFQTLWVVNMIKNPTNLNIPGELSDKQIELVIYMTMDYISTNFFVKGQREP